MCVCVFSTLRYIGDCVDVLCDKNLSNNRKCSRKHLLEVAKGFLNELKYRGYWLDYFHGRRTRRWLVWQWRRQRIGRDGGQWSAMATPDESSLKEDPSGEEPIKSVTSSSWSSFEFYSVEIVSRFRTSCLFIHKGSWLSQNQWKMNADWKHRSLEVGHMLKLDF